MISAQKTKQRLVKRRPFNMDESSLVKIRVEIEVEKSEVDRQGKDKILGHCFNALSRLRYFWGLYEIEETDGFGYFEERIQ